MKMYLKTRTIVNIPGVLACVQLFNVVVQSTHVNITVVTETNETHSLDVKTSDTVNSIMAKISNEKSISDPILEPVLMIGQKLERKRTLADYNIKNGQTFYSLLQMRPDTFTLHIFYDYKTFTFHSLERSTVGSIKVLIQNKINIPVHEQILRRYDEHCVELEDDKTLFSYSIPGKQTIDMRLTRRLNIIVSDVASCSDIVTVEAQPSDTILDVKTRAENILKAYMPISEIGVNFLKAKVQDPRDYCRDSTLNLMLNLFEEELRIFVDETDTENMSRKDIKIFTFEVEANEKIEDIYDKIKSKRGTGINPWTDPDRGKKIYAGQWPCIGRLHGDGSILLSSIYEKSPFDLSLLKRKGMLIFGEPKRPKKIQLQVDPDSYTVGKVIHLIQGDGFSCGENFYPVLSYNNVDMEFGHRLSFYKIQENAELKLKRYPKKAEDENNLINIFILDPESKRLVMRVGSTMKVEELKARIELLTGIPVDMMRLISQGRNLEDRKLSDYGIENDSFIRVLLRLRGC